MLRRFTSLLPTLALVVHTLIVLLCAALAWRDKDDPLTTIFFLPVMILDLPWMFLIDALTPRLTEWLTPLAGDELAAQNVVVPASCLLVFGPIHWIMVTWMVGVRIDRARQRGQGASDSGDGSSHAASAGRSRLKPANRVN